MLWAGVRWDHMGNHSGLLPLSKEMKARWEEGFQQIEIANTDMRLIKIRRELRRLLRSWAGKPKWKAIQETNSPLYHEKAWHLEMKLSRLVRKSAPEFVLLEGIEDQLFLLSQERISWTKTRLVGITHHPQSWWETQHKHPAMVSSLDLLIVLASGVKDFWAQFVYPNKIVFIPHGVDTEFFTPLKPGCEQQSQNKTLRVVFCGQWLRDFKTLVAVINLASRQALNVEFDLVVPQWARPNNDGDPIVAHRKIRWHERLTDEELRTVYRQADVLLLTLMDCTANNSLLEGMACGLPAIVTDVGGVRDYTNERLADFVKPGDASGIVELLKLHLRDQERQLARGDAACAHVRQNFTWKQFAQKLISVLRELPP